MERRKVRRKGLEKQIRQLLDGTGTRITVSAGLEVRYRPLQHDSVFSFLTEAYQALTICNRGHEFMFALCNIFSGYLGKKRRRRVFTAITLLLFLPRIQEQQYLSNFIDAFNRASLAVDEKENLLAAFMSVFKSCGRTVTTYELVRRLIEGANFDAWHVFDALMLEIECCPERASIAIHRLSPMLTVLCRRVEGRQDRKELDKLASKFRDLQVWSAREPIDCIVENVFSEYAVEPWLWRLLMKNIHHVNNQQTAK